MLRSKSPLAVSELPSCAERSGFHGSLRPSPHALMVGCVVIVIEHGLEAAFCMHSEDYLDNTILGNGNIILYEHFTNASAITTR